MSELQTQFEAAAASIKEWNPSSSPSNEDKLAIYGLFKQASEGDVTTERPGMFSMTARAKWDAWKSREGISKDEAMTLYIAEVKRQKETYV